MRVWTRKLVMLAIAGAAVLSSVANAAETSVVHKCQEYEFYTSDGEECFIINVKNTSGGSKSKQAVKSTQSDGTSKTKDMKKDQGKTFTSKYTSITVHENGVAHGEITWTVKAK